MARAARTIVAWVQMRTMSAPLLMALAALLFATMGVCVKLASAHYGTGEIVLYRSLIGMVAMAGVARWRGERLRTQRPGMHFWRSATGTIALCHRRPAAGHRDDLELHVLGVDRAVPAGRHGDAGW